MEFVDLQFCVLLTVSNIIVATYNLSAYAETEESRDLAAFIAWVGSSAYWLLKTFIALMASLG